MIALMQSEGVSFQGIDQILFRWIHVLAGVIWIGHLYFFNFVNSAFAPTLDGETKKKVVPQLMPRALFWFRWGAAFTFVSGVYLLFKLYYTARRGRTSTTRPIRFSPASCPSPACGCRPFLALIVGFLIYDNLFKLLGKSKAGHAVAVVIWGALAVAYACYAERAPGRVGARPPTSTSARCSARVMAANVWMRILAGAAAHHHRRPRRPSAQPRRSALAGLPLQAQHLHVGAAVARHGQRAPGGHARLGARCSTF